MSISFQTSATATKTTSGTTIPITLTSTAGDLIVLAIANHSSTVTVTGVTDTNGNVYHSIGAQNVSTTLRIEMWKTDAVNPLSSGGTITITLSASGATAAAVAATYRGVAFAGTPGTTTTGTLSPAQTTSTTLNETHSWVVAAFGTIATGAWTVQNGAIRNQVHGTTISAMIMDSNNNASPVTCSATFTASNWAAVWNELRLIEVTQLETLSMSDAFRSNWISLSDSLNNWSDALRLGYGMLPSDSLSMSDKLTLGPGLQLSDQLVMSDGPVGQTADWQIQIICPHLNNWNDAFNSSGGGGATPLTLSVSDTLNNWADALGDVLSFEIPISDQLSMSDTLGAGYGNALADNLTMSDSLGAGYGAGLSDQLVLVDSLGAGYGLLASDSLNNWNDAVTTTFGVALTLTDSLNNWADTMLAGYGAALSDQLIITDSLGAGYGGQLSDSLNNWADAVSRGLSFNVLLTDTMNNWQDAIATLFSIALTLTDSLNNWADVLFAGYGAALSDQLVLTDSLGAGYGGQLSDSLNNWSDTERNVIGFNELLADSLNNWSDVLAGGYGVLFSDQLVLTDSVSAGYGLVLSDSLNNWADAFAFNAGQPLITLSLSDAMTMSDFMALGYGLLTSDQLIITDSVSSGYGANLTDSLNSWQDSAQEGLGMIESLSDTLNNWQDALTGLGYGNVLRDTLAMTDQAAVGYGLAVTDQLILSDALGLGYGLLISDSLNNWADLYQFFLQGTILQLAVSDTLNNWTDVMFAGYGSLVSDQLVLADSLSAGYGALLTDTLNNWQDALTQALSVALSLTDTMNNWNDALTVGYGTQVTDSLSMSDSLAAGYGSGFSDQMVLVDSVAAGYGASLSDSLNSWADSLTEQLSITLTVTDTLNNWSDKLAGLGYGFAVADTLAFADSTNAGYGLLLTDSLNNWLDTFVAGVPLLTLQLADTLNSWADTLAVGFGITLADQMVQSDTLAIGRGIAVADTLNNWSDQMTSTFLGIQQFSFAESLSFWNESLTTMYGLQIVDQMNFTDQLTLGYGLQLADSANSWADLYESILHGFNVIEMQFSDTLNTWSDMVAESLQIVFGKTKFRSATVQQKIKVGSLFIRQPNQLM